MFVIAGSASTHAISPLASAASSAPTSFHSTATVVTLSHRRADVVGPRQVAPSTAIAKVSSTVPW